MTARRGSSRDDRLRAAIRTALDDGVERRLDRNRSTGPIPQILHQTYFTKKLPEPLRDSVDELRARNPGWDYRLWDDDDIDRFIAEEYGEAVLARYRRIAPGYGAARADLFRYLLVYRLGGVYLDIKSTADRPFDEVLGADDHFVIVQWDNRPGTSRAVWGRHPDLRHIDGGEFVQWFIAASPGHPLLRAAIEEVLFAIDSYNPYRTGVGLNVVRVTGPIVYTLAIAPLLDRYPHRRVRTETELGLRYSVMGYHQHHVHFRGHYSKRKTPIVGEAGGPVRQATLIGYLGGRSIMRRANKLGRRFVRRIQGKPPLIEL